jgi:hypothetical protein
MGMNFGKSAYIKTAQEVIDADKEGRFRGLLGPPSGQNPAFLRDIPAGFDPESIQTRIDDDEGNVLRDTLGPYRGNNPALYSDQPAIFDQESTPPQPGLHFLGGALTENKGAWGTILSRSFQQGKTRLIIYGDPKTGKPSSWTLFEWVGSGRKWPATNTEIYEWRRAPNAKAALGKKGFYESYYRFRFSSPSGNQ